MNPTLPKNLILALVADIVLFLLFPSVFYSWQIMAGMIVLSLPYKVRGNLYSLFGGFNRDKGGSVYSIFAIFQVANQTCFTAFGLTLIQQGDSCIQGIGAVVFQIGNHASQGIGLIAFQGAFDGSAYQSIGLIFAQHGTEEALQLVGLIGWQESDHDTSQIMGFVGKQSAEKAAVQLFGFAGFQEADQGRQGVGVIFSRTYQTPEENPSYLSWVIRSSKTLQSA